MEMMAGNRQLRKEAAQQSQQACSGRARRAQNCKSRTCTKWKSMQTAQFGTHINRKLNCSHLAMWVYCQCAVAVQRMPGFTCLMPPSVCVLMQRWCNVYTPSHAFSRPVDLFSCEQGASFICATENPRKSSEITETEVTKTGRLGLGIRRMLWFCGLLPLSACRPCGRIHPINVRFWHVRGWGGHAP